jgi:hypothetical protein
MDTAKPFQNAIDGRLDLNRVRFACFQSEKAIMGSWPLSVGEP